MFFTPIEEFTHYARFYGVPLYLKFEGDEPVIAGTNLLFEYLFRFAIWFHNFFIERFAQFFAFIMQRDYEPGFPLMVWEMVWEEENL